MSVLVTTSEIKLTKTEAGVFRIGNTRVSLDSVLIAFNQGATPEQIVQDYDTLELKEIYSVISYYLENRKELDSYLAERSERREELRAQSNQNGIRERLLARRRNAA
jgi:uncharacterized protein (DUF433 family)